MELNKYKLGDLLEVTRGASLSGEFYATEGEFVRLTCGNFDYQNNCFKANTSKDNLFYTGEIKPEYVMEEGDIITPLTEQAIGLLGSTAVVPESGKYIQSQDVAKVVCNEELLDKDFAFYLISSKIVKQQLSAAAQQTKIRHTSPDKIKGCTVWIPNLAEQHSIGQFLRTIDNKIALNHQINHNAELIAKQLFDYWFVQFDFTNNEGKPYKSSGGQMIWNEELKREIPAKWDVVSVKDLIKPIERGVSYSSEELLDANAFPMVNLACFSKAGDYRLGEMKFFSGEVPEQKKISPMSMLIACTDMTQGADIIGRPILVSHEYKSYTFSTDLALIVPNGDYKLFLYYSLRTSFYHQYIRPYASGTTVKHLNVKGVENYLIPFPENQLIKKFENIIHPIKELQSKALREIVELTKLRNELLPLLMNGQVLIKGE